MWTKEARIQHVPRKERYPSDMTDMEWAIIAPLIPPQRPGGRHRETDMREAMNAVRYVLRTGCQWRQLPKDFPPRSTVYNYFWEWTRYGVLDRMLEQSSKPHSLGQPVELEIVKTHGQRRRLQGGTSTVGRRANIILAATQSTPDGSLRSVRPHRRRLCQARNDMHHAQAARRAKAQPRNVKLRVRLLAVESDRRRWDSGTKWSATCAPTLSAQDASREAGHDRPHPCDRSLGLRRPRAGC